MTIRVKIAVLLLIVLLMSFCSVRKTPYMGVRSEPVSDETVLGGNNVPDAGLKAEVRKDWKRAVEIYEETLKNDPEQVDVRIHLAHIYSHLNRLDQVELNLNEAAKLTPENHRIFFELSRTYSLMNRPREGLKAIQAALKLDPDNREYHLARAILANWSGDSHIAARSYLRLAELSPSDPNVPLYLARADAWNGRFDRSVSEYRRYLKNNPDNREVFREYIRVETWRGNYPRALSLLDQYREKFGEKGDFLKIRGDVLARAARPSQGLPVLEQLLSEDSNNYELLYSKAIALHYNRQPREAMKVVTQLTHLRPHSKETDDIRKFVRTPLRSNVQLFGGYYFDSDDLSILTGAFDLNVMATNVTVLTMHGQYDYLKAENDSPFKNVDGSEDARHYRAHFQLKHRFSRLISLDGYLGTAKAEEETTTPVYGFGADLQPSDTFKFRLSSQYGYFIISPRAVSLGIKRAVNAILMEWDTGVRDKIVAYGAYETFSDDNMRWEVIFFPRHATVRAEGLNLDLGFRGWWFGYDLQLGNGYWDPEFFQSYMGAMVGYWKISENDGLSFQAAAGVLKDNTMDKFVFGYSVDLEGIFGIFSDFALKLRASYLHNVRQLSGAFDAWLFTATLIMRL